MTLLTSNVVVVNQTQDQSEVILDPHIQSAFRKLTPVSYFMNLVLFTISVYVKTLHTSIIRNIGIGNVSEKTVSSIKKDIEKARSHLNHHVTSEGRVLSVDKKCEYCKIYLQE
jgi:predicted transcriptional regulator